MPVPVVLPKLPYSLNSSVALAFLGTIMAAALVTDVYIRLTQDPRLSQGTVTRVLDLTQILYLVYYPGPTWNVHDLALVYILDGRTM